LPEIVQEIGAYAGLASVVGLAVLSALYFSQARDVKRLREWAGRAPERAEEEAPPVPGRVTAQPARSPTQPPVPGAPPAASRPAATPAAAAAAGARPAAATVPPGRAGAATPAARPGQPVPAPSGASGSGAGPGTAVPVPTAASAGTVAPAKPAGPGANTGAQTEGGEAAPPQTPQPGAPAPEAAPANADVVKDGSAAAGATKEDAPREDAPREGVTKEGVTTPATAKEGAANAGPSTGPAVSRPAPSPPVPRPTRAAAPTAVGRPGGPTRPSTGQPTTVIPPPRRQPWYRSVLSNPLYAVLAVAGVLIVGGAAAFGITQLVSDEGTTTSDGERAGAAGSDDTQDNGAAADNGGDQPRRAVRPANVTVAVLNGTTVPGLAATLADQVTSAGFKAGTVANFTNNQQLAESVVQYASGHEREAAAVSRRLGIDQREAATAASQELAGDATVIVIAGGDKAP
jgi:hypothetical protein